MKSDAKWIWLAGKCGIGSTELVNILDRLGPIRDIYLANYDDYIQADISERLAESLCDKSLEEAYKIIKYCEESGIGLLTYGSDKYPVSLRSLKDPPAVLYYKGHLPELNQTLSVSVVGTRKMSEYGMRAAYKIAYEVAASGAVVVSGMALGIDSVAASAAMAAGGKTVAVLGSGIDVIYPHEHERLYGAICEHGAVISEYPPSTLPHSYNFPKRNRIISGMSQGIAVIDAGEKSGALITAKMGILQGRDVYAVPSNIDSENSSGTNMLIRDGAQAVLCGYDIIKNYAYLFRDTLNIQRLRSAEERSEFNPSVLTAFGVRAKGERPAFEGVSAHAEKKKQQAQNADKPQKPPKSEPSPKRASEEKTAERSTGDESRAALDSLSDKHRRIFDELPLDRAVSVDYLAKLGFKLGEIISALTVLEIKGLIASLPGGLYTRK